MSARFAELMAMSASQTEQSNAATHKILAEKRRKEEIIAQRKGGTVRFSSINYPVLNLQQC